MVLTTTNLSNGAPTLLRSAVSHAILGALPDAVLSVAAVGVFKPQPDVYALATGHFRCFRCFRCYLMARLMNGRFMQLA